MENDTDRARDLEFALRKHNPDRSTSQATKDALANGKTSEKMAKKSVREQKDGVFAATYAATGSSAQAAAAIGIVPSTGASALARPGIRRAVREANESKMLAAGITAQRVMQELGRIAFLDIRKVFTATGELTPILELDDDTAAGVAAVDCEVRWEGRGEAAQQVTTRKIRTVDKMAALSLLAKHFKLVGDEGDGVNALASALADRLRSARRRIDPAEQIEDATYPTPEPQATVLDSTSEPTSYDETSSLNSTSEPEFNYEDHLIG